MKFPSGGFKINKDSIVVGDGKGHLVCTTTPIHPNRSLKLKDRDVQYVPVATVILENFLGRYLLKGEESHHKNGNPADNSPSNLELADHDDHQRGHAKKRKFWRKSPMNKPGRKSALRVIGAFLKS